FFFSSRRRHTRSLRDWSSDVCSSDLVVTSRGGATEEIAAGHAALVDPLDIDSIADGIRTARASGADYARAFTWDETARRTREVRSEERRVGKEWRTRGVEEQRRKKER